MQSKKMSFIETITGVAIGFIVALVTQIVVFPWFDIEVTFNDNIMISIIFTLVSIVRGYYVRRLFNMIGKLKGNG